MRSIEVVLYRQGDVWVAQALNVDVSSFGDTRDEARSAIQEALKLYFEDAQERGGYRSLRREGRDGQHCSFIVVARQCKH